MNFYRLLFTSAFLLVGCNSIYVKPNTIDPTQTFYADRGGYSMRKSIKQKMEERGYDVVVGSAKESKEWTDADGDSEIDTYHVPTKARYVVKVKERRERIAPIWCAFNGFWWWNFNISIADQITGEELVTWRGRGCQNSSLRKFEDILDEMEIKQNERNN